VTADAISAAFTRACFTEDSDQQNIALQTRDKFPNKAGILPEENLALGTGQLSAICSDEFAVTLPKGYETIRALSCSLSRAISIGIVFALRQDTSGAPAGQPRRMSSSA
jgi:hypothetical protein